MSRGDEFIKSEFDILVYWIREREKVRAAKEAGAPKPWTTDAIIRNHRWCNVRRMDDKVSRELLARWYDPEADAVTDLIAALLARLINWPESLDEILQWHNRAVFGLDCLAGAALALHERANRGAKVFTGAYVVPGVPGMSKVDSVVALVQRVTKNTDWPYFLGGGMEVTWAALMNFDGLGSFLAGQIVADIVHLRTGRQWEDRSTWAPVGPGSARGINRLRGVPKDKAVPQREFAIYLSVLALMLKETIPEIWHDRRLTAMDVQNCLCEFDKYRRLQLGEGKVRARYPGDPVPPEAQSGLF